MVRPNKAADAAGGSTGASARRSARRAGIPAPQPPPFAVGDLAASLITSHVASLRELRQRVTRLEDRLLRAAARDAQRDGDLLVGEAAQLAHTERAAQAVGKLREIGHQQRKPRALP